MSPDTAAVLALAREWYGAAAEDIRSRSANGDINKFLKLWIAFNALYALYADRLTGDHDQIRAFAEWQVVAAAHLDNVNEQVYARAVLTLANRGVYNFRRGETVQVEDRRSAVEVLEAIYQVRCNLFHGRKSPTDLRDRQLIDAAATIVARILTALLHHDVPWHEVA